MPHGKRLPLFRGHLIVRGRWCFLESFFGPIKVSVKSGICHRNLPCPLCWSYCRILPTVQLISPPLFVSKVLKYSVVLLARLGRMYRSEVRVPILLYVFLDRNGLQQCFSTFCNVSCDSYEIQTSRAESSRAAIYRQRGGGVRRMRDYRLVLQICNQVVVLLTIRHS